MLLSDWLVLAERRLAAAGVESARLEAQLLAAHVLLAERSWVLAHPEAEFPELAGESLLQRRERREPLAYILGWREFYGRRFTVGPGVLIPRQETETLVEVALEAGTRGDSSSGRMANSESRVASAPTNSQQPTANNSILDVGTGSGILAITLKLERPEWQVTGVDISAEALEIAQRNARDLDASVRWLLSDGFEALANERFDLIVSNPPYIARDTPLMPEVGEHEPALALYSGETGLEFYERLAGESADRLLPGGLLIVELGDGMSAAAVHVFEAAGWRVESRVKDLLGIDRCLILSWDA